MKLIREDGRRLDGRRLDELRPIRIEANVLNRADGSAYIEWGGNKVLAAVYGPREVHPRHLQEPARAIIQARYNMAAFSTGDRKRPGPDRRSQELSKVISEAFTWATFVDQFPRTKIDCYMEVLQADAGTRCAGVTAGAVALADAGIPMRDILVAVASGRIDGKVVLDLNNKEDNFGEADLPMGIAPRTNEVVLCQMDGHFTHEQFEEALAYNLQAAQQIARLQRDALLRKHAGEVGATVAETLANRGLEPAGAIADGGR